MPVLAPFAAANPDHISAAIDVRYLDVRCFRDPRTGSIHGGQNRSVAKVFRCLQKRLDLFAAHAGIGGRPDVAPAAATQGHKLHRGGDGVAVVMTVDFAEIK